MINLFAVFDWDGTLSDETHRAWYREQSPPDWDGYNEACGKDEPIEGTIAVLKAMVDVGCRVEIWTGRSENVKAQSWDWLEEHLGPYHNLVTVRMRPEGDFRKSDIIKEEWAMKFGYPDIVFEDRPSEMPGWTRMEIPVVCMVHRFQA